jgi:hypothetical protein
MLSRSTPEPVLIPPLISGGLMLTYRCTNACRHCLYRCSPRQPNDWMNLETVEKALAALAQEPQLDSIHLAGGEACLRMDLLIEVVGLARKAGVPLAYLETNAAWCVDKARTREAFKQLKQAGLPAVLVSASMFHNEFVPFRRTRLCVEMAREVFGRDDVIIWLPELYELLSQLCEDRPYPLEEFCTWAGLNGRLHVLPRLYHLAPGGRVVEALRNCYEAHPAEYFQGQSCEDEILNTTHFHIDPYGNLFTGLCPGLAAGTVEDLHPEITAASHPVTWTLAHSGPHGLMEMARGRFGYASRRSGYISRCDLCYDVRRHLHATGRFRELRPPSYYASQESQPAQPAAISSPY